MEIPQCKHLVLACGHDTGYAPFLGQLVGDTQVAERITLLEGSPFPAVINNLGLKKTRFTSIFNNVMQPAGLSRSAGSSWSSVIVANRPKQSEPGSSLGPVMPPNGFRNSEAQSDRLGPILTDENGHRFDRPLQVNMTIVDRIKNPPLCYYLFLRGECVISKCRRNHAHRPLSNEEFDALWWLARQSRCFKNQTAENNGSSCLDRMCVYGHNSGKKTEEQ